MSIRSNGGYIGSRPPGPNSSVAGGIWDLKAVELQKRLGSWPSAPQPDQYWDNVSLLLHMDGSNGSTNITDSSPNSVPVTVNGSAQLSTSQAKFGSSSLDLNGSGGTVLTFPASSLFAPGTGDFTIEAWVYATGPTYGPYLWTQTESGTNYFVFGYDSSTAYLTMTSSGGGSAISGPASSIVNNSWNHIAAVRSNGQVTIYVNGVGGTPVTNTTNLSNTSRTPTLGAYTHATSFYPLTGYVDDFRYTKGVARYNSNFTPLTYAFPDCCSSTTPPTVQINSLNTISNNTILTLDGKILVKI